MERTGRWEQEHCCNTQEVFGFGSSLCSKEEAGCSLSLSLSNTTVTYIICYAIVNLQFLMKMICMVLSEIFFPPLHQVLIAMSFFEILKNSSLRLH
jgi:hypothetical protein